MAWKLLKCNNEGQTADKAQGRGAELLCGAAKPVGFDGGYAVAVGRNACLNRLYQKMGLSPT